MSWTSADEPLLTEQDRSFLRQLSEHPAAPAYNYACGEMLDEEGLQWVLDFEATLRQVPVRWHFRKPPAWVEEFTRRCLEQVPYYRAYPHSGWSEQLPGLPRQRLRDHYRELIPDGAPREQMVEYYTSGTSGNILQVPSHPVTAGCYLPLLRKAIESAGGRLQGGPGRVGIALAFYQLQTLTYPSISRVLDGAAFLKINLHPSQWREPEHRRQYLEAFPPQVLSGNPLSLEELALLEPAIRPAAVVSTSMAMLEGQRRQLQAHFGCPVIDLYSMTECRCLAAHSGNGRYELLAHDVYIEILDDQGRACEPGVRGEITLTGGRNPFQPLLRYRTGDFAALEWEGDRPFLTGLAGRTPVRFLRPDGSWLNNIDVTVMLTDLPLRRFQLHQKADRSLQFRYQASAVEPEQVRQRLIDLFGKTIPLEISLAAPGELLENKWINYTSELF
ncbi:MAG: capsule biosynthesis protein CapK [Candidatus Eremiobacteraeota bacterium]|nr:capsule biosynthesis protein CapK [Candidatus Eremiobacteraeota bacterium]